MRFAAIVLLILASVIFFLTGLWQILTLLPVVLAALSPTSASGQIDIGKTAIFAAIKLLILIVSYLLFRWCVRLVNRLERESTQSESGRQG